MNNRIDWNRDVWSYDEVKCIFDMIIERGDELDDKSDSLTDDEAMEFEVVKLHALFVGKMMGCFQIRPICRN